MFNHPYKGQGLSLPAELGIDGEWVIEDVAFIYRTYPPKTPPNIRALDDPERGTHARGFDADILAERLGISTNDLFFHNQKRSLFIGFERAADDSFVVDVRTPSLGVRFDMRAISDDVLRHAIPKGSA